MHIIFILFLSYSFWQKKSRNWYPLMKVKLSLLIELLYTANEYIPYERCVYLYDAHMWVSYGIVFHMGLSYGFFLSYRNIKFLYNFQFDFHMVLFIIWDYHMGIIIIWDYHIGVFFIWDCHIKVYNKFVKLHFNVGKNVSYGNLKCLCSFQIP